MKIGVTTISPKSTEESVPDSLIGDPTVAERVLGWRPRYSLRETLQSVLDYWRRQIISETND
jgi:nucleoside-diphosphate-sugar epimerase